MRAWVVEHTGSVTDRPLRLIDRPVPDPAPGEVLVKVLACGVCRTDLHLVEGDLAPHRPHAVPGHEVVGEVVTGGARFAAGDRIGIAWLRGTCGECAWCRTGRENLCPRSLYTGWDADGGYADYATVPEDYAYPLPADEDPARQAPLLCAGIIGFRALRRSGAGPGSRLGIWGFGASAHLTLQIAIAEGAQCHVFTRSAAARRLALELGAASAQQGYDPTPVPLDSAILFAPAGDLVPVALAALDRAGVLAVAGIHLTDIPQLNYERHLFYEKELRTVTANTRADGHEFLALAARVRPQLSVAEYPLDAADTALIDLAAGRITGVAVLS
jgi:propanol-preferring alcohol dehydrogenase